MIRDLRTPVDEIKEYIAKEKLRPQKLQLYTNDMVLKEWLIKELPERFPQFAVTSSLPQNIEINNKNTDKGTALLELAGLLGLGRSNTMAFGDGRNDISMLTAAGIGVAMGNAHPDVKRIADLETSDNDSSGVAQVIFKLLQGTL